VGKKGCFLAAVFGVVLITALVGCYIFREDLFGYHTLGGPVALVKGDAPKHGFLGVDFESTAAEPLTIATVFNGSGAAEAGLRSGDVILAAGAVSLPDLAALQRVIERSKPGEEVFLKVRRGTEELEVRVRLISFAEFVVLRQRAYHNGP
jgi:S1-C subfamily serine protease